MKFIASENAKILAFTRTYEEETMLVLVNLSRYTQPVELELQDYSGYVPVEVFSRNRFPIIREGNPYFYTLGAHDCQWFILEKVHPELEQNKTLPLIEVDSWDNLLNRRVVERLESSILYAYMKRMRWFGGKSRIVENIHIADQATVPMGKKSARFLLLEVSYESGLPETYQLPIAFGKGSFAAKIKENCPQAIIAQMKVGEEEGILS